MALGAVVTRLSKKDQSARTGFSEEVALHWRQIVRALTQPEGKPQGRCGFQVPEGRGKQSVRI
jgi:hypothetical protein